MSAFNVISHRDSSPVDRRELAAMQAALAHRGPDGANEILVEGVALGHQHFRTTAEEREERQPLHDTARRVWVAFDGRLDEREQLCRELGIAPTESLSDAALILAAYRQWQDDLLPHLVGSFALVVVDLDRRQILAGRDSLGDCTLFYAFDARHAAVASEEQALLTLPRVSRRPNETSLARFFAVQAPESGATFFAEVWELPPAHCLLIRTEGIERTRYWAPDLGRRLAYRSDDQYSEHLLELLRSAVRCRLRASSPPAVLMSGGLDSTSIAALAAQELAAAGHGGRVRTLSWVFEQLPGADERRYIAALSGVVDSTLIPGDDAWPLSDLSSWPWNPNSPLEGLYRRLQQRAYAAARAGGSSVLLSGDGGDQLWTGGAYWLRDLLHEGRFVTAAREVAACRHPLPAGSRRPTSLRSAVGRAIRWRRRHPPHPLAWLTPHALVQLGDTEQRTERSSDSWRPEQVANLLDARSANAVSLEAANASRAGIEVRRPFRDRRLVEFFLAVPAHQLYRPQWTKWALRRAMAEILPEAVRLRRWGSSLLPLCVRGLVEREAAAASSLLARKQALWRPYVRAEWLEATYPQRLRAGLDGIESVVPWRCLSAELWRQGWHDRGLGAMWTELERVRVG